MVDERLCEERHARIDARLSEVESAIKENTTLVGAIRELAIETKYMREDMNQTMERLTKLESKESERRAIEAENRAIQAEKDAGKWDKFKWLIVAAVVVVIVGYIAVQIGLK